MHNPFQEIQTKLTDLEKILVEMKSIIKPPPNEEPIHYLTREEVSQLLRINPSSVFNWTKNGTLKSYQMGGRVYYKRKDIDEAMVELKK